MTLTVAVIGAAGRMGSEVVAAIDGADDLILGATYGSGDTLGDFGGADVAVDFTTPDVTVDHVVQAIDRGVHMVVGTTGWTDERLARVRDALASTPECGVVIAPNFAIGAVLTMRFAEQAARFYESVEIVELHHPDKVDAPSGTAVRTAQRIADARAAAGVGPGPDATTSGIQGARGATVDGVPVHAVRLRGLVAHEEVLFGAAGETLTLRHDSYDRKSFMPGVLAAVRAVPTRPGVTIGLDAVLGLDT